MNKWVYISLGGIAVFGVVKYLIKKNDAEDKYYHPSATDIVKNNKIDIKSGYGKSLIEFANNRTLVSKIAQDLHDAMKGFGTDFHKIKSTLQNLDDYQFEIVYRRFGIRPYGKYGEPMWGKGINLNLSQWFKQELTESQYNELKHKFPKLL